jgi:hypothetical protein
VYDETIRDREIISMDLACNVFNKDFLVFFSGDYVYYYELKYFYVEFVGKWKGTPNSLYQMKDISSVRCCKNFVFLKAKEGIRCLIFEKNEKGKVYLNTRYFETELFFDTDFNELCIFETRVFGSDEMIWVSFPKIFRFGVGIPFAKFTPLMDDIQKDYEFRDGGICYNKDGAVCFNYVYNQFGQAEGIITGNMRGHVRKFIISRLGNLAQMTKISDWEFDEVPITSIAETYGEKGLIIGTKDGEVLLYDSMNEKVVFKFKFKDPVPVHGVVENFKIDGLPGILAVGPNSDYVEYRKIPSYICDKIYLRNDPFYHRITEQRVEVYEQEILENIENLKKELKSKKKEIENLIIKEKYIFVIY